MILHFLFQNTLNQDPGTSDDSGRASERLTTSSVAQRDQDSSRDRLSDVSQYILQLIQLSHKANQFPFLSSIQQASSRCSSGKGYIVSVLVYFCPLNCVNCANCSNSAIRNN